MPAPWAELTQHSANLTQRVHECELGRRHCEPWGLLCGPQRVKVGRPYWQGLGRLMVMNSANLQAMETVLSWILTEVSAAELDCIKMIR